MNIAKFLTLPVLCILESCIEAKIIFFSHFFVVPQKVLLKQKLIFFSHFFVCASKGFMEAFKAFIKRFEAPLRTVKIKVKVSFSYLSWIGTLGIRTGFFHRTPLLTVFAFR